ncbi:MAG: hypothetical protein WAN06_20135 [Candidatus Sulfotelmatobacter sp.]
MFLLQWRNLVCGVMAVVLPASLMAQDSARAILHNDGGAWVNGNPAPQSSAIFMHDLVRTQKENRARIDADGSTVTVERETIVQFEGDELVLEHGSLQVNTWRGMRVRVNCVTVSPPAQEWARYDVTDVDGRVLVLAYQNDVKIHYSGPATWRSKHIELADETVNQGGQATHEDRCGEAPKPAEVANAKAPILDSVWAKAAGITTIGVITCWALCRGDNPVSPSKP